jgi:hypothetical protein
MKAIFGKMKAKETQKPPAIFPHPLNGSSIFFRSVILFSLLTNSGQMKRSRIYDSKIKNLKNDTVVFIKPF